MKKILYPLALFLALVAFGGVNAQQVIIETTAAIQSDNLVTLRQNINRPITQFFVNGHSAVKLVYDTTNYIVVSFEKQETNPLEEKWVVVKGMTLFIDDPDGYALYEVHLKKSELQIIKNDYKSSILYASAPYLYGGSEPEAKPTETTGNLAVQQQLDEARDQLDKARNELVGVKDKLSKTLRKNRDERIETYVVTDTFFVDSTGEMIELEPITDDFEIIEMVVDDDDTTIVDKPRRNNYYYHLEDRSGGAFLWGFNNWGSNWYNGLNKMEGAYELRTSFSSWQLELTYSVVMTRHFCLDLGVGYESDIYKFTAPLIDIDNNGLFQDMYSTSLSSNYGNYTVGNQVFENTRLDDWSSRLVTRYFSLPIDFVFRFNNDFKIGFAAIPALAFSSSHTGLKHEIDTKELEHIDVESVSKYITPYKLDLRFTVRYDHFGVFAQFSTTSLFTNKDVYPIKIGFILK